MGSQVCQKDGAILMNNILIMKFIHYHFTDIFYDEADIDWFVTDRFIHIETTTRLFVKCIIHLSLSVKTSFINQNMYKTNSKTTDFFIFSREFP